MGRKRRIEIRISTHQTLKIGPSTRIRWGWCARCDAQVEMIEMGLLDLLDPQASGFQVDAVRLHVTTPTAGPTLVCLRSLIE